MRRPRAYGRATAGGSRTAPTKDKVTRPPKPSPAKKARSAAAPSPTRIQSAIQDRSAAVHSIERHFHELIRARVVDEGGLALPAELPHLVAGAQDRGWFPVQGMVGGFSYQWDLTSSEPRLVVESWSRVFSGSGQRHLVTAGGARLVEEGFV